MTYRIRLLLCDFLTIIQTVLCICVYIYVGVHCERNISGISGYLQYWKHTIQQTHLPAWTAFMFLAWWWTAFVLFVFVRPPLFVIPMFPILIFPFFVFIPVPVFVLTTATAMSVFVSILFFILCQEKKQCLVRAVYI